MGSKYTAISNPLCTCIIGTCVGATNVVVNKATHTSEGAKVH